MCRPPLPPLIDESLPVDISIFNKDVDLMIARQCLDFNTDLYCLVFDNGLYVYIDCSFAEIM